VLKDAGVVDSGGQGWTFIIEGMLRMLRGEDIHIRSVKAVAVQRPGWQEALVPEDEEGYGYDVQFLMKRLAVPFDVDAVRAAISEIGWSTLVVGDEDLIKVHVHVHDPGIPISYAIGSGAALDDVVVENMQLQYRHYVEDRRAREGTPVEGVAVVTVASGDGLRRLFAQDLQAASVIAGGQTMNPSTEDFLAALEALPNEEIILLPNNPNVIMAAQQAAALTQDKKVHVVPSRTIPQGISAMFTYLNEREQIGHDELAEAMRATINDIVSCEVTTATRAAAFNGVNVSAGQLIGLINDVLVVAGDDIKTVVSDLLHKAGADKRELVTLYYGHDVTEAEAEDLAETLREDFSGQEFQLINGGQPLYPYIIGVE
jgi:DAK2 domain fusion protein YloV